MSAEAAPDRERGLGARGHGRAGVGVNQKISHVLLSFMMEREALMRAAFIDAGQ
mgnify:CR=1 FL=1